MDIHPDDEFNQALLAQVHPQNWKNPPPQATYDLVVIGAGTAGLVTAIGTAELRLGLKIALVEQALLGGDCLNWGCVPSKTLLESARVAHLVRRAGTYGVSFPQAPEIDFAAVMARVRQVRAEISSHDSVNRCHQAGIDVFFGTAQFINPHSLKVDDILLPFKRAVITTGAKAVVPEIPGLETGDFLTHETIFNLTELPARFAIVGGGPIGCELGQALQRLGSQVTIIQRRGQILPQEDQDIANFLEQVLEQEGVRIKTSCQVQQVQTIGTKKMLQIKSPNSATVETLTVDRILIAGGRAANVASLGLVNAGIDTQPGLGIVVNDYLQTSQPHIFAAGDVCSAWKFTHAADAMARIVIKNALFAPWGLGREKVSDLLIPRVTYTDPEIAMIGLSPDQAQRQAIPHTPMEIPLTKVDRAVTAGQTRGFLRLVVGANSDKILGAVVVGPYAGELISAIIQAMQANLGLQTLAKTIFPYPTQAEILKKAADYHYQQNFLTPWMQRLLKIIARFNLR